MKLGLVPLLVVLTAMVGCQIDVSKLRAGGRPASDASADAALDLAPGPDLVGDGAGDPSPVEHDAAGASGDAPQLLDDADASADLDETERTDASQAVDSAGADAEVPDLPLPPADLSPTWDVTQPAEDLAGPPVDVAEDQQQDLRSDVAVPDRDLAPPRDVAPDAGGRPNGLSCTNAGQCQSGICVGTPGRCCPSCTSACYRPNECSATGACVPVWGAVTCGDLDALCGLTVNDGANAADWSLKTNLQVGDLALGSDDYRLIAVPTELAGAPWIRPSRLSKSAMANPLVTVTISAPADVYVGIDTRIATPSWLSGWTDSGLTISYRASSASGPPSTVTQQLLVARFPAGDVTLGPLACTITSNCSMYLTIIRFADQPAGTPPICGN